MATISVNADTAAEKKIVREDLRMRLAEVDAEAMRDASLAAGAHVMATSEFIRAETVMIYLPLRYELDARPIALRAWQEGKSVAVPLIGKDQRHILPVTVKSLDEPMDTDEYGVQIPVSYEPVPVEMIDMVVTPGLGFDRSGHRLGRGGGYYDRFLSHPLLSGLICGFALDEQVVQKIPVDAHDISVEMLATPTSLIRCMSELTG